MFIRDDSMKITNGKGLSNITELNVKLRMTTEYFTKINMLVK